MTRLAKTTFNLRSRGAFRRAKDKPDWTEEWTQPAESASAPRRPRVWTDRERSLRNFLRLEFRASKTDVERLLLSGLLIDVPGTLRLIG